MDQTSFIVEGMLERYSKAVLEKDLEGFLSLYDKKVLIYDMWEKWSYEGLDQWRSMADEWFKSLGDEKVRVDFKDTVILAGSELSTVTTVVTYTGISEEGEYRRHLDSRMTWVLKSVENALKVVHEHSSAPASFESLEVILRKD